MPISCGRRIPGETMLVTRVAVEVSFCLGEQKHNPGPFWSCYAPLGFVGSLGSNQSVAGLIVAGLSIHKGDVAVGPIALDII